MSKPFLQDRVIFRMPRFSYTENLADNWEELKNLIAYSSPDFYELIKELSVEELAVADQKIQMTVNKYFNRSRYRSTPYGGFATVGIGNFDRGKGGIIELQKAIINHAFVDWKISEHIRKDESDSGISFFTNTTFYRVQEEIRYLQKMEAGFHAAAIDYDQVIWELLDFCNPPKQIDEIISRFPHFDRQELVSLIDDLVGLQLLLTSDHPNIIGEDYFNRIGAKTKPGSKQYLIAERKFSNGTFDKMVFRHIPDLIDCLQKIRNTDYSADLRTFRNDFIRRYGQAEIPLLEAIDPEAGIGYGNFTSQVNSSPLTRFAAFGNNQTNTEDLALRNVLYAEIISAVSTGKAIELEKLVPSDRKTDPLPNTLTILCNLIDESVWLDFAGGASATAILGRFALAIPEIEHYCRDLATLEQKANPSVLFFDIGYTKEISVDNINRRPAIYDRQLNILNFDTSAEPLGINDILVSVRDNEVVLRSKSSGKRLVPRLCTMYNYQRSDLSLFRLLMDIQFQGIASHLMFNVAKVVPGLSYYPRIQFRNIIVSPAIWKIHDSIFSKDCDKREKLERLKAYLNSVVTSNHLKAGATDQTLLLDTNSNADIALLLDMLEKNKEMFVEETQLPETPFAFDHSRRPMFPQMVLTLSHSDEVYKPMQLSGSDNSVVDRNTWIAPGGDWLYFEIFISPYQSDIVLHEKISRYLYRNRKKIKSWFFIRYTEDGDHIRLRLKISGQQYGYLLIKRLSELLRDDLNAGIISDIRLRVYRKEVQRYLPELINQVEDHFHKDSQFVINMLSAMLPDTAKYKLCIDVLEAIAKSDVLPEDDFIFTAQMTEQYLSAEHGITTENYKEINRSYRSFLTEDFPGLSNKAVVLHQAMIDSFTHTIRQYEASRRPQILADLVHMHINRLFAKDQRLHELIIYNYYLNKKKAEKKRQLSKAPGIQRVS